MQALQRTFLGLLVFSLMAPLLAAPITDGEPDLLKIQLAVIFNASPDEEQWSNTKAERDTILNELKSFEDQQTFNRENTKPTQLLERLNSVLRRSNFKLAYGNEWVQPTSRKRKSTPIFHPTELTTPFNLLYGTLKLEERTSLVARLNIKLVDQNTLALEPKTQQLNPNPDSINTTEISESENQSSLQQPSDVIFLNQQRKIRLGRIQYFDHPITPAFLLVEKITRPESL